MDGVLTRARKTKHTLISLDFSRFDQHIHPIFRDYAAQFTLKFFNMSDNQFNTLYEHYTKINRNQWLCTLTRRGVEKIPVNHLLGSGMKDTQQSGSFINLMVQVYAYMKLFPGKRVPVELMLCLGDDVVFPVPNSFMISHGYEKTLTNIKNVVSEIGFTTHDQKAYPTPEVTFLQKLYSGEVFSQGTIMRTIRSMVYREKNPKNLGPSVNIPLLEIIGQISMTNEMFGYGHVSENDLISIVIRHWLREDKLLLYYVQTFGESPNTLFSKIIHDSNSTIEDILTYLDKSSYDHSFTKGLLTTRDFGSTFPVLSILIEIGKEFEKVPESAISKFLTTDKFSSDFEDQYLGEGD